MDSQRQTEQQLSAADQKSGGARLLLGWSVTLILAVGLIGVLWPRVATLDQWPGVAQLTAFRPQLTVAVIILAGLGLGTRLRYKSLVFLLIGVISAGGLLSRIVGDTAPQTGTQLRVLTLNVTRDSTDQVELIRLIRTETPHVIALPEASKPYVTELVASFAGEYTAATDVRRARDPERRRPGYENEPANAAATSVLVRSEVPTEFRPATPYTTLGSMQLTIELQGRQVDIQEGYSASLVTIYTRKCMSPLGVSPRAAARLLQESGLP